LRVVDKFVNEVSAQLIEKKVTIEITEGARQWLGKKGFDKLFGARPMARLVQQKLREPLAEEILFGKLEKGGSVLAIEKDDDVVLEVEPTDYDDDGDQTVDSKNVVSI
jgi:ATP-dependent Clp protease ATP-binding subunit ClpA